MSRPNGPRRANADLIYTSRSAGITYLSRFDMCNDIEWKDISNLAWYDISTTSHRLAISATGDVIHKDKVTWSPIDVGVHRIFSPSSIKIVSLLGNYHNLSTVQIATFLGVTVRQAWNTLSSMFAAGLIMRALPPWMNDENGMEYGGSGSLWRLDTDSPRLHEWEIMENGLNDLEHLLAVGSRSLRKPTRGSASSASLRHNLVTAEVMLRALEVVPRIVGTWGEIYASSDLLLPEEVENGEIRSIYADGLLVLDDGKALVIETVASRNVDNVSRALRNKVALWTYIAGLTKYEIGVLFLDASPSPKVNRFRYHVAQGIEEASAFTSKSAIHKRGSSAIYVAHIQDWFPVQHGISAGFSEIEVWSPIKEHYLPLAPHSLALSSPVSNDLVVNTLAALHTPSWIVRSPRELMEPSETP